MEDLKLDCAIKVLNTLNDNGYQAYMVGGFVRDYLLGIESHDIDIATNAIPEKVQELFPDNFNKSDKFKTVTVRMDGFEYEITTYRTEKSYKDHRHPKTKVSSSLKKDVKRRDFTINAMAMDRYLETIDYVDGKEDLKNKIIRTVGKPTRRFNEDGLRMLRAFRFACRLDFTIEKSSLVAIEKNAYLMKLISKERVRDELEGIISSKYFSKYIDNIIDSNIFQFYPDILKGLKFLKANYKSVSFIQFYTLLSYLKGSLSEELLLSKKERKHISDSLNYLSKLTKREISPNDFLDINMDALDDAFYLSELISQNYYDKDSVLEMYNSLEIHSVKELDLSGDDIKKEFELEDSPIIKDYLNKAILGILKGKVKNNKKDILKYLKEN